MTVPRAHYSRRSGETSRAKSHAPGPGGHGLLTLPVNTRNQARRRYVGYWFLTNNFPGNCRTTRFISRLSSATETAEAGRPLPCVAAVR